MAILSRTPKILLYLLLFFCIASLSQTLINSTGGAIVKGNSSVEYSIGEISTSTLSGNIYHSTQGLLQPVFQFKSCNVLKLIPTAFTPNGDNLNDCFGVKKWPVTAAYELCIYNRWGQRVFKTTNILECWNGTFNGVLQPMDAYVYTLKATTAACGQISHKGTIVLIR